MPWKLISGGESIAVISVIAIDGPVAAGKTVVGRALAQRLGFKFLDTGVMYRAITWLALERNVPIDDENALAALAEAHPVHLESNDSDRVLVGEHSLGVELKESKVTGTVSLIAQMSSVRRALVRRQRLLGSEGNIVMVGRDIGTVVLPNADLKIYLSASPELRARRRWQEMVDQGQSVEFQQVLEETRARDEIDSDRADSPLKLDPDAFLLDTEGLDVEQVIGCIRDHIGELSKQDGV